jgi:hypothetical protein
MNKTDSEEKFKVKKGVGSDPGLQRVEKRLAEKISEINLPFEDELRTIEEEIDIPFSQTSLESHTT